MEKIKWALAIVGGAVSTFAKQYHMIIAFVLIAIITDFITGLLKAKATGEGLNSEKATKGFWKKMALLVALFFGFFLDYFVPFMLHYVKIDFVTDTIFFAMTIGCYIVLSEMISVTENLFLINPDILPKWVTRVLTVAKDKIENMEEVE